MNGAKDAWQSPDGLLHGGSCNVPNTVAVCPECGGPLHCRSMAWETSSGRPIEVAMELTCDVADEELEAWARTLTNGEGTLRDEPNTHKYHQYDWQPVRDAVAKWTNAIRDQA